MKLPSFKRLIKTDYKPEFQDLIETLGGSLNEGINALFNALNKRLTFQDNFACTVKDIIVKVDSNGIPTQGGSFNLDVQNLPVTGLLILRVQNLDNSASYITTTPFINFVQNGNSIIINNIAGLAANTNYRIRVLAIN